MKYAFIVIAVAILIIFATKDLVQTSPELIKTEPELFDPAPMLEMKNLGDFDLDKHFSRELMVIFYLSELSCETCAMRELGNVAQWREQYGDRVDFFMVVQGRDPVYLSNLKRLGKVNYPIFLEDQLGDLGFSKTVIAIADKSTGHLLAQYHPMPDMDTAHLIEDMEEILRLAVATKQNRAQLSP